MVYVDELRSWPQAPKKGAERWFGNGKSSSHLTADSVTELLAFAEKLGLKRQWLQVGRVAHFDLIPGKREKALTLGATFVPAKEQARRRRAAIIADGRNCPEVIVSLEQSLVDYGPLWGTFGNSDN